MHSTLPEIALSQPARPRTFRVFRDIKSATQFAVKAHKCRCARMRKVEYGTDSRDVRFVVNLFGSNPRHKVSLAPARVIFDTRIETLPAGV